MKHYANVFRGYNKTLLQLAKIHSTPFVVVDDTTGYNNASPTRERGEA